MLVSNAVRAPWPCPGAGSARCGRHAPAAALLALSGAVLLLLARAPAPPRAAGTLASHATHTTAARAPPTSRVSAPHTSTNLVTETLQSQQAEQSNNSKPKNVIRTISEPAAPDGQLTLARYVAGHSRAHAELCAGRGARLRLVVLVTSAPAHAAARDAVRLTWGHAGRRADVALAFVLGAPPPELRAALDAEDALYGDLIEGRFVDSYLNLTLKTLSMLEWVSTHCPLAPRLLKTDDDMFINVEGLLRFAEAPARRDVNATVWGKVWQDASPERNPREKYYVPPMEFPHKHFPPYASGAAYLMSGSAAPRLLRAALAARWLRMEDVLVTGVARARAQVRLEHAPQFAGSAAPALREDSCALRRRLAVHGVRYEEQFDLWRSLLRNRNECPT